LAAGGGTSKTTLLLHAGIHMALGRAWLGIPTNVGTMVLVSNDDSIDDLKAARKLVAQGLGLTKAEFEVVKQKVILISHYGNATAPRFFNKDGEADTSAQASAALLTELEPIADLQLIILDTLRQFGGGESNDEQAMRTAMDGLRFVCSGHPAKPAGLFAHHTGKAAFRDAIDDQYAILGSSAITDNARAVFLLQRMDEAMLKKVDVEKSDTGFDLRLKSTRGSLLYKTPADLFFNRTDFSFEKIQGRTLDLDELLQRKEDAKAEEEEQRIIEARTAVLRCVQEHWDAGHVMSQKIATQRIGGKKIWVEQAWRDLVDEKMIVVFSIPKEVQKAHYGAYYAPSRTGAYVQPDANAAARGHVTDLAPFFARFNKGDE
jgi:RecA-family ATPase